MLLCLIVPGNFKHRVSTPHNRLASIIPVLQKGTGRLRKVKYFAKDKQLFSTKLWSSLRFLTLEVFKERLDSNLLGMFRGLKL